MCSLSSCGQHIVRGTALLLGSLKGEYFESFSLEFSRFAMVHHGKETRTEVKLIREVSKYTKQERYIFHEHSFLPNDNGTSFCDMVEKSGKMRH